LTYQDLSPLLSTAAWAAARRDPGNTEQELKFCEDYRKVNRRKMIVDLVRTIRESLEVGLQAEENAGELSAALTRRMAVSIDSIRLLTDSDLTDLKIRQAGFAEDDDPYDEEPSSIASGSAPEDESTKSSGAGSDAARFQTLLAELGALGYLKSEADRRGTT